MPSFEQRPYGSLAVVFYCFLFVIPFETLPIPYLTDGSGEGTVTLAKVLGLFLVLLGVTNPGQCFRSVPATFGWLSLYVLTGVASAFFSPLFRPENLAAYLTFVELLGLFLLSYNLLLNPRIRYNTAVTFCLAGGVFAFIHVTGVVEGRALNEWVGGVGYLERTSGLGQDPNFGAVFTGLSLLTAIAFGARLVETGFALRLIAPVIIVVDLLSIVKSGSRGGLLTVTCGLVTLMLCNRAKTDKFSWRGAVLVLAAAGLLIYGVAGSDLFRARLERAVHDEDTSGRLEIWQVALDVWTQEPVFGHGFANYTVLIGPPLGKLAANTHNAFISALTSSGALGGTGFFVAVALALVGAVRARTQARDNLPLVWLATSLVAAISLNVEREKWFWMILAYALAAGQNALAIQSYLVSGVDRLENGIYRQRVF